MAIYNEILVGRYARMLQKLFGIKGTVPTKQLAGEILPSFNLFNGVENRYLEGWDRFAVLLQSNAAAANNSNIRLRNPAGSNVIAVFEKITFTGTAAGQTRVQQDGQVNLADLAVAQLLTGNSWERRGRTTPTLVASITNAAGILSTGFTSWAGFFPANQSVDVISFEDQEITLLPGSSITCNDLQANVTVICSFIWRERFLEEGERT